jgi:hypothetical protein
MVCQKDLGSTYVVNNNIKMHRKCEHRLHYCAKCYDLSRIDMKCLNCNIFFHKCETCNISLSDVKCTGNFVDGRLLCMPCARLEYYRGKPIIKRDFCFVIIDRTFYCECCQNTLQNGELRFGKLLCNYCIYFVNILTRNRINLIINAFDTKIKI